MKTIWVIGVHNSAADEIEFYTAEGSKRDVKREMMRIIYDIRSNAEVPYDHDHGTEYMSEIETLNNGSLYGYIDFDWSHTDVTARKFVDIVKYN